MKNKLILYGLAAGIFALDQLTKAWIVNQVPLHEARPVTHFFALTHLRNTGAAFGILADSNLFFIVLTIVVVLLVHAFQRHIAPPSTLTSWAIGLLTGGALGNLADRVRHGSVTDFLDFHWAGWHWPAFNVADASICTAVGLLILASLKAESRPSLPTPHRDTSSPSR